MQVLQFASTQFEMEQPHVPSSALTQLEMDDIRRWEENERRMALTEEDFGDDIDGVADAYDSEEDWSFEEDALVES
jgi:hypothetical protein